MAPGRVTVADCCRFNCELDRTLERCSLAKERERPVAPLPAEATDERRSEVLPLLLSIVWLDIGPLEEMTELSLPRLLSLCSGTKRLEESIEFSLDEDC